MYDDLEDEIDFLDEDLDEDMFNSYDDSELIDVDDSFDDEDFAEYYESDDFDGEAIDLDEGDSLSRRGRRARRRARRRRIFKRAGKMAVKLAKKAKANAARIGTAVGAAVAGPAGAAHGAQIGNAIQNLEDSDWDDEEWEYESWDDESDTEDEMNAMMPMSSLDDSLAEAMASAAAKSNPSDAQALGGALTLTIASRAPMAVKKVAPALACATGRITKQMATDHSSRPLINMVPTIVKDAVATLNSKNEKGKPITSKTAGRVLVKQAKRTLQSKTKMAKALTNNALKKKKLNKAAVARAERFY